MRRVLAFLVFISVTLLTLGCEKADEPLALAIEVPEEGVAHLTYFYASECSACDDVMGDVLTPVFDRCGAHMEMKMIDIAEPEGYSVYLDTETFFIGEAGRWEIPTIVTEDAYFIGEAPIRERLASEIQCIFGAGGNAWPQIESLLAYGGDPEPAQTTLDFNGGSDEAVEACVNDESEICMSPSPIYVLYVTDTACVDACERTLYDLRYLQGIYPTMEFEERPLEEADKLVKALLEEYEHDVEGDVEMPFVFVGEDYLAGDDVTVDALKALLYTYTDTGAPATWYLVSVD